MSTTTMHPVAQSLRDLMAELNASFQEREECIEAMTLAVLSKEHIFILGPPGTGKSALTRAFVGAFMGARYFECAMSKTRGKSDVFGPVDTLELRNTGNQWRKDTGFITTVEFAFVDEIGKMSSILGHDMLAVLNERVKHEVNGSLSHHPVPLSTAFTASNELVTDDSDDAAALWDRLLFRVTVDYIKSKAAFMRLFTGGTSPITVSIDYKDLADVIDNVIPSIGFHKDALKAIAGLKQQLAGKGIHISDRRWVQSAKALQASAFLNGRSEVFEDDLTVLRHTLWDTLPQLEEVSQMTAAMANPFVEKMIALNKQTAEIAKGLAQRRDRSFEDRKNYARDANVKLGTIRAELDALLTSAGDRPIPDFKAAADAHEEVLTDLYVIGFELPREDVKNTIQSKLGLGDGTKKD